MSVIRWLLGRIILFFNFIFSPKSPKLSPEQKAKINEKTQHMSLYQLPACPFCVKVRREMKRQGIHIELRNINQSEQLKQELIEQGGKRTVPCLRVEHNSGEVEWMYESSDIVDYLKKNVAA